MAVPRAQLGGTMGSGLYPSASPPLDIANAITAATQGASTLIQNAYLRKRAKAEDDRQARIDQQQEAERTYQHGQDTIRNAYAQAQEGRASAAAGEASTRQAAEDYESGIRPDAGPVVPQMLPHPEGMNVPDLPIPGTSQPSPRIALSGGRFLDPSQTPEARKKAEQAAQLDATASRLVAAGIRGPDGKPYSKDALMAIISVDPTAISSLLTPKAPILGSPAYNDAQKAAAKARTEGNAAGGGGSAGTTTKLDRQINDQQQVVGTAERAIPKIRPPQAMAVDQYGVNPNFDAAAGRSFVADSTAKAGVYEKEKGTLDRMREARGDRSYEAPTPKPEADPHATAKDAHAKAVAAVKASDLSEEEKTTQITAANRLYQQAIGAMPKAPLSHDEGTAKAADSASRASWAARNPPKPGETLEQYKARGAAALGR